VTGVFLKKKKKKCKTHAITEKDKSNKTCTLNIEEVSRDHPQRPPRGTGAQIGVLAGLNVIYLRENKLERRLDVRCAKCGCLRVYIMPFSAQGEKEGKQKIAGEHSQPGRFWFTWRKEEGSNLGGRGRGRKRTCECLGHVCRLQGRRGQPSRSALFLISMATMCGFACSRSSSTHVLRLLKDKGFVTSYTNSAPRTPR
jgi:hypothetical protein